MLSNGNFIVFNLSSSDLFFFPERVLSFPHLKIRDTRNQSLRDLSLCGSLIDAGTILPLQALVVVRGALTLSVLFLVFLLLLFYFFFSIYHFFKIF